MVNYVDVVEVICKQEKVNEVEIKSFWIRLVLFKERQEIVLRIMVFCLDSY